MKLNWLIVCFFVLMLSSSCTQKSAELILDLDIKDKCIENINITDFPDAYSRDSAYETTYKAKHIVEDTVYFNYLNNNFHKKRFTCNHYYDNDTLVIDGGFGAMGIHWWGFVAKVFPNKKTDVKLQLNWGYPSYYNKPDETTEKRSILVNTKRSKLILNRLPKNEADNGHIYGYIELTSDDYFVRTNNDKTKIPQKAKCSYEYKIYFDSRYFDSRYLEE